MWDYSRVVYGREGHPTPLWLWVMQRATAVLLGPAILVHMLVPGAAGTAWADGIVLVLVLAHGAGGVWRLAAASGISRPVYGVYFSIIVGVIVILAVLGAATVFAST